MKNNLFISELYLCMVCTTRG
uniref:Uncharacterized protein n=1 Tax=Anguilla anguilla TaxID=7936 RepID=A0A0E9PD41_ANGAN